MCTNHINDLQSLCSPSRRLDTHPNLCQHLGLHSTTVGSARFFSSDIISVAQEGIDSLLRRGGAPDSSWLQNFPVVPHLLLCICTISISWCLFSFGSVQCKIILTNRCAWIISNMEALYKIACKFKHIFYGFSFNHSYIYELHMQKSFNNFMPWNIIWIIKKFHLFYPLSHNFFQLLWVKCYDTRNEWVLQFRMVRHIKLLCMQLIVERM